MVVGESRVVVVSVDEDHTSAFEIAVDEGDEILHSVWIPVRRVYDLLDDPRMRICIAVDVDRNAGFFRQDEFGTVISGVFHVVLLVGDVIDLLLCGEQPFGDFWSVFCSYGLPVEIGAVDRQHKVVVGNPVANLYAVVGAQLIVVVADVRLEYRTIGDFVLLDNEVCAGVTQFVDGLDVEPDWILVVRHRLLDAVLK